MHKLTQANFKFPSDLESIRARVASTSVIDKLANEKIGFLKAAENKLIEILGNVENLDKAVLDKRISRVRMLDWHYLDEEIYLDNLLIGKFKVRGLL